MSKIKDGDVINTWTTAHISSGKHLKELGWTVESIKKTRPNVNKNIYISFFVTPESNISSKDVISKIMGYESETCKILLIHSMKKLIQFEHLQSIFDTYKFDIDSPILFMDADDMLFNIPLIPSRGMLYLWEWESPDPGEITYDMLMKLFEKEKRGLLEAPEGRPIWRIENDFSGYFVPYKWVAEYFTGKDHAETAKSMVASIEDTQFMDFLDRKGAKLRQPPHAYYRLRHTHGVSWMSNIAERIRATERIRAGEGK